VTSPVEYMVASGVLPATAAAALKIGFVCWFVGRLMASGKLPKETPQVLSRAAFHIFIPCTLAVNVAQIVARGGQELASLAVVPVMAAAQVGVGLLLGSAAAKVVDSLQRRPLSIIPGTQGTLPAGQAIAASTAGEGPRPDKSERLPP